MAQFVFLLRGRATVSIADADGRMTPVDRETGDAPSSAPLSLRSSHARGSPVAYVGPRGSSMTSATFSGLVKPSSLSVEGNGKDLSDGWAVNFAVGCTHGCLFSYVWRLHLANKFSPWYGLGLGEWGECFYVKQESFSYIGSVSG